MFRKFVCLTFLIFSMNAVAAENRVIQVYSCSVDVGILVENEGWLVAKEGQIGEKRVDRILALATTLLATQTPIGYFDRGTPQRWCGIENVRPITVLQISR